MSEDVHPQFEITFGGKNEFREPEKVDAEEFIAKKGINAKGKKVSSMDVKCVKFIEPLVKPEDAQMTAEETDTADDTSLPDDGPEMDTATDFEPTLF